MKETFAIFGFTVVVLLVVYFVLRLCSFLLDKLFWIPPAEVLDNETYVHRYKLSAIFVADYIISSFKEGVSIHKHGTLGKALFQHWHHACKYLPKEVKCLDSESQRLLESDPATFYIVVDCKEEFIEILRFLK